MLAPSARSLRASSRCPFRPRSSAWIAAALLPWLATGMAAHASITPDTAAAATAATGTTTFTLPYTLGIGANRLVVCSIGIANPTTAVANVTPTVTFGGLSMAPITASLAPATGTSKIESLMYYINDTTLGSLSGSQTVSVTLPGTTSGGIVAGCSSFFGVAQQAPEASTGYYNGSGGSAPATASVTTLSAGDLVLDALAGGYTAASSGKTATPNTGQTATYPVTQLSTSGILGGGSYLIAGAAGSVTTGWADTVSRLAYSVAAFAPAATVNYALTTAVSPTGGGSIALSPSLATYPSGTSVQLTATPAAGYAFTSFSGDLTSTTNPATLLVTKPESVTANFTAIPCTLTITVVGSGTVTPTSGSQFPCGTQVQVTATPSNGYSFGQFSGALTGATNPQTLTLNASSSLTATFVQGSSCTLSTSTVGSGTLTLSPSGTVFSCGTPITVTATPATYYSLTGFSGALTGTTSPQTFTLNANSTLTATFTQTSFPINTTIVGPGTVSASPADPGTGYAPGTQVTLTATPASGAYFVGFTGAQTSSTSPLTLTVNSTTSLTATFANAVITRDAVSHAVTSGAASTLTWQHTLGVGANRALVIAVGEADTLASPDQYATVTSVLFNGVYATPVPNSVIYGGTSGMVQTQLFYLLEPELPAAGTYTVQVNLSGSIAGISAGAVSLFGVNPGPPEAVATSKATTGVNLISTSITTLTNNAWVIDLVEDGDTATLAANSGQTLAWQAEAKLGTAGSSTEAVPSAGTVTLGWTGTANRLTQSLVAFPPSTGATPVTTTLTTSVAGGIGGTVSPNPSLGAYPVSAGVLLSATPAVGYAFSGWTGDYTSTTNPLPITMDTNRNVVANFTTAATCTVNFTIVGSGSLNLSSGTYNCGTVLQLQATPAAGYTFTSFSGDFSSTNNPAFFTLTANSSVTVEFDPIPTCSLTVTTVGQGTVSPGTGTYTCGTVLSLSATAAANYAFSGFSGDLTSTDNPLSLTLSQNTNLTATFLQASTCTLSTTVVGQGTITPSSGSYACGTTISLQAVPASKYLFNGWSGALSGYTTPTSLTLSSNASVTATFAVNTAGVTGDTRTVTEPSYPPVCTVLTAVQSLSAPIETSPDTARIQAALNACPVGQAVQFSASADGTANAFILQPITLPAGVTMLVDPEVTLLGSIKYADYACNTAENWCNPLINIAPNTYPNPGSAIMGLGVIDGRGGTTLTDKGESWWKTGQDARPRLVYLSNHTTGAGSDNFTAYKITLKNSPKFHLSGVGNDWTVWGIKVIAPPDSPNTDGVDPSGSSNVTVTHSYISDGDDWVSPKADSGHIANVTVSNNYFYSGHGVSIGSETNAGLNNMFVHDDVIDNGFGGTSFDSLRIKSGASEGGEVYDVLYKNICINNGGDTIVIDPYYTSASGTLYPNFHDITFSNVHKLLHNSSYKSTMTGYNTNGIVFPLTVTLDNVSFDNDTANDFKAPDNFNNVQFTFGPGPVSMASFLTTDAAVASNYITVNNSVTNPTETPFSCTGVFVYLAGDLTAKSATVTAGNNATLTAVLQNVVSPLQAGTISYPQQNPPSGTINILEGSSIVGTATIATGSRLTYITVPAVTAGTHTYTAQYTGDSHYAALSFGSFTLTAAYPAPVANSQSIAVPYNTPTALTLTATGSGTLTYDVLASPTHGTLTGTAPALTYTPTSGYSGPDSFTFTATNGTVSSPATVTLTVAGTGSQSQTITFTAPSPTATYGASPITLSATSTSGLAVTFAVSGPATLSGTQLAFTGQGTVTLTASQAGNSSYSAATPVQRSIVVGPATLNLTVAGSPSRYFDQPNPVFAYTLGPFVNSDTQATATTGLPTLTTTATPLSAAGAYPITVSTGTLAAANYTIVPSNGQLTVNGGVPQSIVFAPLPSLTHTVSIPLVAFATSGLPVTFSVTLGNSIASILGTTLTLSGSGSVSITASQPGNGNFSAATPVTQTFTAK